MKGPGGIIGLTENPSALHRWLISGPEVADQLENFEPQYLDHPETGKSFQKALHKHVLNFVDAVERFGNPFEDDC